MAPDEKTALLIIDAQQEYFAPGGKVVLPAGPSAVKQIARVLAWARAQRWPIVHVVHESRRPGAAIFVPGTAALEIHPEVRPSAGEPIVTKHLPGSFTGTSLEQTLLEAGVGLVVTGFMTQMCVDTTTREAAHRGFKVTVLADATAAMDVKAPDGQVIPHDQVHRTHLGSLSGFLAEIKHTDDITG
jgi:nicotinamidase-related amidase